MIAPGRFADFVLALVLLAAPLAGTANGLGNAVLQLSTFEACAACMNVQAVMFEAIKVRTN